jgi:hypothetical protein
MKILEINCETGEQIEREATAQELAADQLSQAAEAAKAQAEAQKALDKATLLEKLGISESEAALLLS